MTEITTTAAALDRQTFTNFITWIDRSEATSRAYIINLRQFVAWMNFTGCTAPAREDILSYRDYLSVDHEAIQLDPVTGWRYRTDRAGNRVIVKCKPATVAQYLRSVTQFFTWTAAEGIYPNVAQNIHPPKVRHDLHKKDALTAGDVKAIQESIEATAAEREERAGTAVKDKAGKIQRSTEQGRRLRAIYLLAVTAGLRTIEISRANVKDLESKGGRACLYVWGKGHSEPDQKKPLAPEVYQAIREYLDTRSAPARADSPLFVSTGNRSGGQRIAPTTISTMLKRAMQEAGYDSERITAHSLRHTAGTAVMEMTGNLYTTQQYMRHSSPATTEVYLHMDTERQDADIAQRLYTYYQAAGENS